MNRLRVLLLFVFAAGIFAVPAPASAIVWYVNDTSLAGDSFTTAMGSDSNPGNSPAMPVRTLNALEAFLSPGDTIYVDAGYYYESDTFTITMDSVSVIGKDSNATFIVFDSTAMSAARGIYAKNVSGLLLRDIEVEKGYNGIWFDNVDNALIERAWVIICGSNGFLLENGSDSNIIRESISSGNSAYGIKIQTSSSYNTVETSSVSSNSAAGINVWSGTGNVISGNTVNGNTNYGIFLTGDSGTEVTGNTTNSNTSYGIYLSNSGNDTIRNNVASGNSSNGIYLFSSSNHLVSGNTTESNSWYGIYLDGSSNVLIRNNRVRQNALKGLYVFNSSNNVVTGNEFLGNKAYQVVFDGNSFNDTMEKNNILPPATIPDSGVQNISLGSHSLIRNWWGTVDSSAVRAKIWGWAADSLVYIPFRLGPVDTAPGADTVAPAPPDTVEARLASMSQVDLSWAVSSVNEESSAVPPNVAEYRIYRSATPDTTLWALIGTVAAPSTFFSDSTVNEGETWYYRVTAVDNAAPYPNESFYSDSIASIVVANPAPGPNVWYVNDTDPTGDTFTTALGSSANDGLSPATPKRFLDEVEPFLTEGDTIYLDAGTYQEPDTVVLDTTVFLIGRDSTATVIDFGDQTIGGYRMVFVSGSKGSIESLRITNGYNGIRLSGATNATVRRVRVDNNGSDGIIEVSLAAGNLYVDNVSETNGGRGFAPLGGSTLTGNIAQGNAMQGFHMRDCFAQTNMARANGSAGFFVDGGTNNVLIGNLSENNTTSLGSGFKITISGVYLAQNTAKGNSGYAFDIGAAVTSCTLVKNNIEGGATNPDSGLRVEATSGFSFTRNWWGTADSSVIWSKIWGIGADSIVYIPFRLGAVDTAPGADTVAPRAPDTVEAAVLSETAVQVSWSLSVGSEEPESPVILAGYRLYRSTNPDTSDWGAPIADIFAPTTDFIDSGLAAPETYFYRVTAYDDAFPINESFYSDSIAAAQLVPPPDTIDVQVVPTSSKLILPAGADETGVAAFAISSSGADTIIKLRIQFQGGLVSDTAFDTVSAYSDSNMNGEWDPGIDQFQGYFSYDSVTGEWVYDTPIILPGMGIVVGGLVTVSVNDFALPTASFWVTVPAGGVTAILGGTAPASVLVETAVHQIAAPPDTIGVSLVPTSAKTLDKHFPFQETGVLAFRVVTSGGVDTITTVSVTMEDVDPQASTDFDTFALYLDSGTLGEYDPGLDSFVASMVASGTAPLVWTADSLVLVIQGGSDSLNLLVVVLPNSSKVVGGDTGVWLVRPGGVKAVLGGSAPPDTLIGTAVHAILPLALFTQASADSPAGDTFAVGETLYIGVEDAEENRNPLSLDSIIVTVTNAVRGDTETLIVPEDGPDSDVFFSALSTSVDSATQPPENGVLYVTPGDEVRLVYQSVSFGVTTDTIQAALGDLAPPGPFSLLQPAQGTATNVASILFGWSLAVDSSPPITYRLLIDNDSTFASPAVDTMTTGDSILLDFSMLPSDTYYWRVVASDLFANSRTVGDSGFLFDIDPPETVVLLAPADGTETVVRNVLFQWNSTFDSHSGVAGYRFQTSAFSNFSILSADTLLGPGIFSTTAGLVANDTTYWRVNAVDGVGNMSAAVPFRAIHDTMAPTAPALIAPVGGVSVVSPVFLDWGAASDTGTGVASYTVEVDTAGTFLNPVLVATVSTPGTTVVLPNDTYYWRVGAADRVGNTALSGTDSFQVVATPSETVPPDSFTLISPVEGYETTAFGIAFSWSASNDSSLPITYRLLVDDDPAFGTPAVDSTTTLTSLSVMLPSNAWYFWRVTATDAQSNSTTVGDSSFLVDNAGPTAAGPIRPVNGETTTLSSIN
ncbi:MAG: right-handed parallel beta-helix repeat-containing protein, partial [Candidatus Hydrogenedentota bacterium]